MEDRQPCVVKNFLLKTEIIFQGKKTLHAIRFIEIGNNHIKNLFSHLLEGDASEKLSKLSSLQNFERKVRFNSHIY